MPVYLKAEPPCTHNEVRWELYNLSNAYFGGSRVCHDIERKALEQAGTYTIKVFVSNTATGDYGFTLVLDLNEPPAWAGNSLQLYLLARNTEGWFCTRY